VDEEYLEFEALLYLVFPEEALSESNALAKVRAGFRFTDDDDDDDETFAIP
jgi:hypothetical protein